MSKKKKFLDKIINNQANVKFEKMQGFIESLGFELTSKGTGHHVYKKTGVSEIINITNRKGEVHPYQVRQIIDVITRNKLI